MQQLDLPARPAHRSVWDRIAAWVRWFGPLRVASGVLGLGALVAVGAWAVRAPSVEVDAADPASSLDALAGAEVPAVTLVGRPAPGPSATVFVHVAGAVVAPGVHELTTGTRVIDAIRAAGGPLDDAELDALNLAAPLADGQRIHVPRIGEVVVGAAPIGAGTGGGEPAPIDLNRATAAELEGLPGVGPAIAAEIVADRERNGPFAAVDDLLRVRGIGPAKLAGLRDRATVS